MAFNKSVAEELFQRIMNLSKYDSMIPSDYQKKLIDFIMSGQGNGLVQAVAGSGKTTTIMQALNELRKQYGALNKPTIVKTKAYGNEKPSVDYINYKGITYKSGTTHSVFGKAGKTIVNYALMTTKVKHIIMGSKYKKQLTGITLEPSEGFSVQFKEWIYDGVSTFHASESNFEKNKLVDSYAYQFADIVEDLVGILKNCGVGIFPDRPITAEIAKHFYYYYGLTPMFKGEKQSVWNVVEPNIFQFAIDVLLASNKFESTKKVHPITKKPITVSKVWDYDDFFYLTALYNADMPEYDYVFLDECQDTNLVTQLLVKRIIDKSNGRAIAVGDVAQAIYAFRGADANAMNEFAKGFQATTIPLSLCYRCGSLIIQATNQIFNEVTKTFPYTQIKALDTAPDGLIFHAPSFNDLTVEQVKAIFDGKTGVICRKNAPLMKMMVKLFIYNIPVKFLGKSEIGKTIINKFNHVYDIFNKTGFAYDVNNIKHTYEETGNSLTKFNEELSKHRTNEFTALEENGQLDKMDKLKDDMDCVSYLGEIISAKYGEDGCNPKNVEKIIQDMFSDEALQNTVTLTSVHRSKGLEFHRAVILNYESAFFNKLAKQTHLYEQECNMAYVALTRAERELVFVNYGES